MSTRGYVGGYVGRECNRRLAGETNIDKEIPLQAWTGSEGSRSLGFPGSETIVT